MRAILLPILLSAALLLAPVALADGDDDDRSGRDAGKARAAELRANASDHDDDDDNESERNRTSDRANRSAARASFHENRTALFDRVIAQLQTLRDSWHENATKVREGCRAGDFDHANATKENRTAHAHCVRDGYKAWRAAHSAEIKELREEIRALLESRRGDD